MLDDDGSDSETEIMVHVALRKSNLVVSKQELRANESSRNNEVRKRNIVYILLRSFCCNRSTGLKDTSYRNRR
jgi:hypothetical protein